MGSVGAVRAGGGGNNMPSPSRAELIDRVRSATFTRYTGTEASGYRIIVDGVGRGAIIEEGDRYRIAVARTFPDGTVDFIDIPSAIERFDGLESAENAVKMWLEYIARGDM